MNRIEPTLPEFGYPRWDTPGSFPAIEASTGTSWERLEIILAGVTTLAERRGWQARFGKPARLEFFWNEQSNSRERGVLIYDSRGQLIVHVVHALLGYTGSGPGLSEQILTALGAEALFPAINRSAHDNAYTIVVSRQLHAEIENVDTAIPSMDVEPSWTWWRAAR